MTPEPSQTADTHRTRPDREKGRRMSAAYHIAWTDDDGEHHEVKWDAGEAIGLFCQVVARGEAEDVELRFSS